MPDQHESETRSRSGTPEFGSPGFLENLLTIIEAGRYADAGMVIQSALVEAPDLDPADRTRWLVEEAGLWDQAGDGDARFAASLAALEALAADQRLESWQMAVGNGWIETCEGAARTPTERLLLLEQLALAPNSTELGGGVARKIEDLGYSTFDPALLRDLEVLLHQLGAAEAAYRLEAHRRRLGKAERTTRGRKPKPAAGRTIVIAGGHQTLRATLVRRLIGEGAKDVREIAASKEATRSGRDVRAKLAGADLVVVLIRQIGHSTGDQVRIAAESAAVPVIHVDSLSPTAIVRSTDAALSA